MTFPVTTRLTGDRAAVIAPSGDVDLDNAFRIREAVDAALIGRKPGKIVVDLTDVTVSNSDGAQTTIQTTQHHPFWDATSGASVAAELTVVQAWTSARSPPRWPPQSGTPPRRPCRGTTTAR